MVYVFYKNHICFSYLCYKKQKNKKRHTAPI